MAITLVVAAYLCGSIPSGVLLARRAGVDVRRTGSGNIGATNVARTAGLRLGLMTLGADVAKGLVPVAIARATNAGVGIPACVAVATVLGHVYPPVLGFAGGKGVATALGASLALYPLATVPTLLVFGVTLATFGWVSFASIVAASSAPVSVALLGYPGWHLAAATAMTALVVLRHRDNVRRLLAGSEPKLLPRKQALPNK